MGGDEDEDLPEQDDGALSSDLDLATEMYRLNRPPDPAKRNNNKHVL